MAFNSLCRGALKAKDFGLSTLIEMRIDGIAHVGAQCSHVRSLGEYRLAEGAGSQAAFRSEFDFEYQFIHALNELCRSGGPSPAG